MSYAAFVPLRTLSSFSLLEGAIHPEDIAKTARERGFPAAAICDRNGLYGAMPFAKACIGQGIQPIIGTLLGIARPTAFSGGAEQIDFLALYAQNERGYENLCHLVSAAHLGRPLSLDPHIGMVDLEGHTDGLIGLTAGGEGLLADLVASGQHAHAEAFIQQLGELFADRLYVELSRREDDTERAAEQGLIDLAYRHDLPLVATNPACFAEPHMHAAHDAMLCIAQSSHIEAAERRRSNERAFLKSASMMEEMFADIPEAIANTLVIAQRCAFAPPYRKPILPSLAGDLAGEVDMLAADARKGLDQRLGSYGELTAADRAAYEHRLQYEVDIINQMGFPGYFLIVADFIKWAKEQGIPVGPGRGSGAGSLVAWALTITDLDPIRLGLLFERFLNPERVSMPDFDIDFCETRRGEVIRYVQAKYGEDHVAQIITFGKLKARAVLRDCGRILQMSYGHVDRLCKMIPNHPTDPWTLPRALNGAAEFRREYENDNDVKRLVDLAMQLEGYPRNSSTHAAGVVIGDRPLVQLVPLYRDPRSDMPVTQFDMKYVETSGLVKFDFLGLKTLSVLQKALSLLDSRGIAVNLAQLPLDDAAVFALLQNGNTVGVFQLESEGMRRTLTAVKPTKFEDIIALVSLYRPGPMDNIPLFGRRKAGEESIEYPHPKLEGILAETYGIFVYQEQVMQAAQVLAGYSLGEADLLRRAMGKKVQAEMDAQRQRFVDGCGEVSAIDPRQANELFDLIDKFAGYGFNKSHAAAYALLAYQTGWIKAHYPAEFFAASMCFDMHQSEKLNVFVEDARRNGVAVLGPDINRSDAEFMVEQTDCEHAVRYGLAGLRNVGEKAMEALVAEREQGGPFASVQALFERLPKGTMNSRQLEALIGAGTLDGLEPDRARLLANADVLLAVADAAARERDSGQVALFGGTEMRKDTLRLKAASSWSRAERMIKERDSFGFYFSAHPVTQYHAVASAHGARSYARALEGSSGGGASRTAVLAALVENAKKGTTKRGKTFVRADFSDGSGQFAAACFEETLVEPLMQWAGEGACVLLDVEIDSAGPDEAPRVTVRGARPLDRISGSARMLLACDIHSIAALETLKDLLARSADTNGNAHGEVRVRLHTGSRQPMSVRLGQEFSLSAEIAERAEAIEGLTNASLTVQNGSRPLRLVA